MSEYPWWQGKIHSFQQDYYPSLDGAEAKNMLLTIEFFKWYVQTQDPKKKVVKQLILLFQWSINQNPLQFEMLQKHFAVPIFMEG